MKNFSNHNDSCSESCQDSFFSEVYLLLLTQSLVRLTRHTHTPKCNESAKIWQIINCGLTILIVSVFPVPLRNYDTAQICCCWQNGRYFYKTQLATLHMLTKRT